jgi:hypothetical protein
MYKAQSVQITYGGRAYNASYRIADGVHSVDSAYGSRSADLKGRSDHKAWAEAVLRQLVEQWEGARRRPPVKPLTNRKAPGAQLPRAS